MRLFSFACTTKRARIDKIRKIFDFPFDFHPATASIKVSDENRKRLPVDPTRRQAMRYYYSDEPCREACGRLVVDTRTGRCETCQAKADKRNAKARCRRQGLADAMASIGVKRVRGALGGTYWE